MWESCSRRAILASCEHSLWGILRRYQGHSIALALRPSALQITSGVLRRETPEQIASHLQNDAPMETIEVGDEVLKEI